MSNDNRQNTRTVKHGETPSLPATCSVCGEASSGKDEKWGDGEISREYDCGSHWSTLPHKATATHNVYVFEDECTE